ncbi:MAG: carbohydrate-binding family 9-like protein [Puia sp.]|nr:carbohydrate-binding family 9-like protein [Puia sp.]
MKPFFRIFCLFVLCSGTLAAFSQTDTATIGRLLRAPLHYVVSKTDTPPVIDGDLNDPAWKTAAWTEYFSDIEGDIRPKPLYATRVKMLWDDRNLYIAAELEEPNIWAYVANHDEVVFRDNDFEIFVNPDNNAKQYFEIEINAIQTIFDLFLPKAYRNGGGALVNWDAQELRKAVRIEGTLNDPKDKDRRWLVEYAIPIYAVSMGTTAETPVPGTLWRINFSRVEWDTDLKDGKYIRRTDPATHHLLPEHNWVWSPQGVINMHFPERWGYLLFAGPATGSSAPPFVLPAREALKNKLWEVYYRQNLYYQMHGAYANTTDQLSMDPAVISGGLAVPATNLVIEATPHTYKAILTSGADGETWAIGPDGEIENMSTPGRKH